MLNALTIDLEDYYHVTAFNHIVDRGSWDMMESRIERNCGTILSILNEYNVKATFFVLGWVAERFPILVRTIFNEGHEISSHGYNHVMINQQSRNAFKEDIIKSKSILEEITGSSVKGYRAPTFSVTNSTLWALNILREHGHLYDSSIFPIKHDRYGIPGANRFPHLFELNNSSHIKEFPLSTVNILNRNVPIAGGGYLRILPIQFIEWSIKKINTGEKQPAIIYLHPWEFDPGQPRLPASILSRFRHYCNLHTTEKKLSLLIKKFRFTTLSKLSSHIFY